MYRRSAAACRTAPRRPARRSVQTRQARLRPGSECRARPRPAWARSRRAPSTLRSRICGSAGCRSTTMKAMWPAITSSIAGTLPRYGTWRISIPDCSLQHFGAEMLRATLAGRAIGQPGFRSGVGDELGQRLRRDCRIDDQRERHAGQKPDRREIPHRIVGQFPVKRLVDGERGRGRHQQRVAVGLGSARPAPRRAWRRRQACSRRRRLRQDRS